MISIIRLSSPPDEEEAPGDAVGDPTTLDVTLPVSVMSDAFSAICTLADAAATCELLTNVAAVRLLAALSTDARLTVADWTVLLYCTWMARRVAVDCTEHPVLYCTGETVVSTNPSEIP